MTNHVDDPVTHQQHPIRESHVWVELENSSGEIITVHRGVVASADNRLVSVFPGALLSGSQEMRQHRDYFVLDPGAAQREAGFHHMLANFFGWELPTVHRYDGAETTLYLETIFPLLYVEQKAGWSALPAAFPTYFQIRDVGRRAVEFLLGLGAHNVELQRQQVELDMAGISSAWNAKQEEVQSLAGTVQGRVERLVSNPTGELSQIEALELTILEEEDWRPLSEVADRLRSRVADLEEGEIDEVEDVADELVAEASELEREIEEQNDTRWELFRARQDEHVQRLSIARRLSALEEDLQKNLDAQKLRSLGSTTSEALTVEHCPTCDQPIADTLLAQRAGTAVMSLEDNIEYIKAQRGIFQRLRSQSEAAIEDLNRRFTTATAELNENRTRLRALKTDLVSRSDSPSSANIEERLRLEMRLKSLEDASLRFEQLKTALVELARAYATLLERLRALPADRLSTNDREKIGLLNSLVRDQLAIYNFSTFPPSELEVSEQNFRPHKEGFEIGFELSASDSIRLKWAFQLALVEVGMRTRTNHPGFLIFDEPRQQETARVSFRNLLARAAAVKSAGRQIIFATSEDREQLEGFLEDVDCEFIAFDGPIVRQID